MATALLLPLLLFLVYFADGKKVAEGAAKMSCCQRLGYQWQENKEGCRNIQGYSQAGEVADAQGS